MMVRIEIDKKKSAEILRGHRHLEEGSSGLLVAVARTWLVGQDQPG